jgi:DGQHR domain-containing protein
MYSVAMSASQIRALWGKVLLVDQFDSKRDERHLQGYQRFLDKGRTEELTEALNHGGGEDDILPPLLPGSIVLNCRKEGLMTFDSATSKLRVPDIAELYVIDGQHRVEGIVGSVASDDFVVPVVIVDGLDVFREAGQFLTINTKQTKVKADLQLRVLYNLDRHNTHQLVQRLDVEDWRFPALTHCMALEDDPNSPWRNMILRPGEERREESKHGRWKPMTERNFVDTLRFFCGASSPVASLQLDERTNLLINYWDGICKMYPNAFDPTEGKNYMVCKSIGVGSFNYLAPVTYWLKEIDRSSYVEALRPLERLRLDDFWAKRRGRAGEYIGGGHKAYSTLATKMLTMMIGNDYVDDRQSKKLLKKAGRQAGIIEMALDTLRSIYLRSTGDLKPGLSGHACYVLVQLKPEMRVYVGSTRNVKQRIAQPHPRQYQLYNRTSRDLNERTMQDVEMALFHLVKESLLDNVNHPTPMGSCRFC